jgi:hypothetical protein
MKIDKKKKEKEKKDCLINPFNTTARFTGLAPWEMYHP